MKNILPLLIFLMSGWTLNAQQEIELADNTFKVGGVSEKAFYYGFAAGDKLVFSFEEQRGKPLKEIEILELPGNSKFMEFKSKKIDKKEILVSQTGIYMFRFSNTALSGRVCKFKVQRIPANPEVQDFNSTVYWRTVSDTSYQTIEEKYLVRSDTAIHHITDQLATVHSYTNLNGNKTTFNFSLPDHTIAWSYYVGVDQQGKEAFDQAATTLAKKAGPILARMPGYGPMAALALNGTVFINRLQQGEDIDFYIVEGQNVNLFLAGQEFYYLKKGKVINDFSKMTAPLKGMLHFCLLNDNAIKGVSVTVKITAICVQEVWGTRPKQQMDITHRKVPYLKH